MRHVRFIVLLVVTIFSSVIYAEDNQNIDAFDYINELRTQTGMQVLQLNQHLAKAANNHAYYCAVNQIGGHFEREFDTGFTGYDHTARINYIGYLSSSTGENVSSHKGRVTDKNSIDGLMSAIYHRFGFLSFDYDEIGIGKSRNNDFSSFVYNMGNTYKNKLCYEKSSNMPGKYFSSICRDKRFRISAENFKRAERYSQENNPKIVLWPAADGIDVPPAFFEESPDPLPNYGVSGYPISIQFNPISFVGDVPLVTRFELFEQDTDYIVKILRHMNKMTDQHKKFDEYEHAIFPEQRLKWSSRYRAEVDYNFKGVAHSLSWVFSTRELGVPLYEVINDHSVINESSGNSFAVYIPPRNANDAELAYSTKYRGLSSIDIQILDGNTLLINATGSGDAEISFHGVAIKIVI